MSLLTDLLNRFLGAGNADGSPQSVSAEDFTNAAKNVGQDVLSKGLSAALGSSLTPDASQMISQMFGASSPEQRAGMLNHMIETLGPAASSVLGGVLSGALGRAGAAPAAGGAMPQITPEQASQVSPQQVQVAVSQARQQNPDIVDSLSGFYAQHPGLVKTLGGAALAIALGKISEYTKS